MQLYWAALKHWPLDEFPFRDAQYLAIDERRFAERFAELVDAAAVRRAVPQLARGSTAAAIGRGEDGRALPKGKGA